MFQPKMRPHLNQSTPEPGQPTPEQRRHAAGQSLIELALILPILLIMVLGLVEVAAFVGSYLDGLDLVREAARFASLRDPFYDGPTDMNCRTEPFDYYYDTVCIFSPPAGSPQCSGPSDPFCNGINSATQLDMTTDDVVISAYTVVDNRVSASYPPPAGYYAYSDHDSDTDHNSNWQYDCDGNIERLTPFWNEVRMNNYLSSVAPPKRGFVVVEYYYCYHQWLNAPLISQFLPNPVRIHVYTVISLPAAIPTSTPYQTPTPGS
ncbi:MAG: pilus assembly protein [Anaerolineae bacterium]|nr:pilus assembly protein [Anaerolineae bacterium]